MGVWKIFQTGASIHMPVSLNCELTHVDMLQWSDSVFSSVGKQRRGCWGCCGPQLRWFTSDETCHPCFSNIHLKLKNVHLVPSSSPRPPLSISVDVSPSVLSSPAIFPYLLCIFPSMSSMSFLLFSISSLPLHFSSFFFPSTDLTLQPSFSPSLFPVCPLHFSSFLVFILLSCLLFH